MMSRTPAAHSKIASMACCQLLQNIGASGAVFLIYAWAR